MYSNDAFKQIRPDAFSMEVPSGAFRLLQLTDLHLGFGPLSVRQDKQALAAVETLVNRTSPDFIVITGDSIYPFLPSSGTLNNKAEAEKLLAFLDGFKIPYALVMGNHDTELGSRLDREELGHVFETGEYSIFTGGPEDIYGTGNYMLELRTGGELRTVLCFLDSNMYVNKLFFSGFDRIHSDQTAWCMSALEEYQREKPNLEALAFYHMPLREFKEAYEKMKLGDRSVIYNSGTVAEAEDYFGISSLPGDFFNKALENGAIKYMFCGHDHLNNISLTYRGITMTYGMSIDCLGYTGINRRHTQRGATQIELTPDNKIIITPVPLTGFVTKKVRGADAKRETD